MRPVSGAFLRAVRGSHTMAARARVCTTFATGTDPAGTTIPILGGTVHLDATADIRSTLDMLTDGTGMWPAAGNTLLAPYGNEVFVERGIQFGGGTTEWCSLGYFRIDAPSQDWPPDGPIRIAGADRMAGIVDGRLVNPRQYLATNSYGDVVNDLVLDIYPTATIEWDDATDDDLIGRAVICEEDRYGFLADMVRSLGKVWFWDHRGVLVIKDPPDPDLSVFDVTHGVDGVLVSMSRELSRDGVYNAVVATGEAADTTEPVRAVAVDGNPLSPTWWEGPFGKVPRFFSSPFITSPAQASAAAAAILRQALGLPYSVDFTAVPNPALEPRDPVRVSYSGRAGSERHIIETMDVPLTAEGALSASTREQTVVVLGSAT